MAQLTLHPDMTAIDVDPDTVVRIGKVSESGEGPDPSCIVTTSGRIVVEESIRTIAARFGDALLLCDYDDPSTERPSAFALRLVAALTKPNEDSADGDPTLVHLATGEALLVRESIRTLSARLNLDAGIKVVDVDVHGTGRPAAVVAAQVASVLRLSGAKGGGDEPTCVVVLPGDATLLCRDDVERLRRRIAEASVPAEPVGAHAP
jgi:hypothetical protein